MKSGPRAAYPRRGSRARSLGSPREFDELLAHCATASWRPVIDSVFPLAQAAAAHERLDAPERFGKIVLAIDESRFS